MSLQFLILRVIASVKNIQKIDLHRWQSCTGFKQFDEIRDFVIEENLSDLPNYWFR